MRLYQNVKLYSALKLAVLPVMPKEGMNSMRVRWDALWASKFDVTILHSAGYNDNHIDTALKLIATLK